MGRIEDEGGIYGRKSWHDFVEEGKEDPYVDDPDQANYHYLPEHLNGVLFAPITRQDTKLSEEQMELNRHSIANIKTRLDQQRANRRNTK